MNKVFNKKIGLVWALVLGVFSAQAQSLSLDECYRMARENYPLIKKLDLIEKTKDFDVANANKAYLPQLSISGQATYQSETMDFSNSLAGILPPNVHLPEVSKDQYKIVGEVSQLVYNGGATQSQKKLLKTNAELQKQGVENQMYALKKRINELYFSILLTEEQLKQNELSKESLQTQLNKAKVALKNGTTLPSNVDELQAEIVNVEMKTTEFKSNKSAFLKMLSVFIGKEVSEETTLQTPYDEPFTNEINRPELKFYSLQKSLLEVQEKQLKVEYLPKISLFFQGAYGRPTLNMLKNEFAPWYVTGVRLNWSLSGLYTQSSRRKSLEMSRLSVESDQETFLMNTQIDLSQQDEQVKKYSELIRQDQEMVALRHSVAKYAQVQLDNGVITTHEYIQKVNAENLAKQILILHEIQLLQAKQNQKLISGN